MLKKLKKYEEEKPSNWNCDMMTPWEKHQQLPAYLFEQFLPNKQIRVIQNEQSKLEAGGEANKNPV